MWKRLTRNCLKDFLTKTKRKSMNTSAHFTKSRKPGKKNKIHGVRELAGQDKGIQAGFVDDGRLLISSHGVTNRYPIVLQFVFGVNLH